MPKATEEESVPVKVNILETVKIFPSAIVRVEPVTGVVMVNLFIVPVTVRVLSRVVAPCKVKVPVALPMVVEAVPVAKVVVPEEVKVVKAPVPAVVAPIAVELIPVEVVLKLEEVIVKALAPVEMEEMERPDKVRAPDVAVRFIAPVVKVKPLEAVRRPVEVNPEVAVMSPEIVGVAVQTVPVTVKLPPRVTKLLPETVNVLSRVVAPCKVRVPVALPMVVEAVLVELIKVVPKIVVEPLIALVPPATPIVLAAVAPVPKVFVREAPVPKVVAPDEVKVVYVPPAPVIEPITTKLPSAAILIASKLFVPKTIGALALLQR